MAMSINAIDDAIDALKDAHGVLSDRDLAVALDIDASTISTWRRRGSIPKRYLKGLKPPAKNTITSAELAVAELFLEIYDQLKGKIFVGGDALTRKHWAHRLCALQLKVSNYLRELPDAQWPDAIKAIRQAAFSGDPAEFIERVEFVYFPAI